MPSSPRTIIEHTSSVIPCSLNAVPARKHHVGSPSPMPFRPTARPRREVQHVFSLPARHTLEGRRLICTDYVCLSLRPIPIFWLKRGCRRRDEPVELFDGERRFRSGTPSVLRNSPENC